MTDQEHLPPFSVANKDHSPLLRDGPESPSTHPPRFNGRGLILCLGPCPHFGLPCTSGGQGPHHEIRPCPSEGVLFTPSPFHNLSNLISLIDLRRKRPKTLQVVAGNGLRLQGGCGWWATLPVEAGPGFQPDCSVRGPSPNIPLYGAGAGCGEQHPRAPQRERRRPVRRTEAESRGVC